MNLIIAVYSATVSQLAPHGAIISKLQCLSIMLVIERRLGVILYPYYYVMQKYSTYVLKDKRIFILSTEECFQDNNPST